MPVAVEITDGQIQALADAIASGELRVTMPDGATVQYADAEDLLKRYNWLLGQKAARGNTRFRVATAVFV